MYKSKRSIEKRENGSQRNIRNRQPHFPRMGSPGDNPFSLPPIPCKYNHNTTKRMRLVVKCLANKQLMYALLLTNGVCQAIIKRELYYLPTLPIIPWTTALNLGELFTLFI